MLKCLLIETHCKKPHRNRGKNNGVKPLRKLTFLPVFKIQLAKNRITQYRGSGRK